MKMRYQQEWKLGKFHLIRINTTNNNNINFTRGHLTPEGKRNDLKNNTKQMFYAIFTENKNRIWIILGLLFNWLTLPSTKTLAMH